MVRTMAELKKDLDDYYAMGLTMANAYIERGSESGNQMMDKFDPFAEKLSILIEKLVVDHEEEQRHSMQLILSNSQKSSRSLIVFSMIALIISAAISFLLTRSITIPLSNLVSYAQKMKNGDLTASLLWIKKMKSVN